MAKTALGILAGILIFIAAGILAAYWIGKMRVEREQKKPRLAKMIRDNEQAPPFRPALQLKSRLPV